MENNNYLLQLSMLEQESKKIEQHLEIIRQQTSELQALQENLRDIEKTKSDTEILSPLGRGIYFKSELKEKNLFVNIGSGIVLRKTPDEAVKIIDKQISQLNELRESSEEQIANINAMLQQIVKQAQKEA